MKKILLASVMMLAACASQPDKIQATDVSTLQYQKFDCHQLAAESARITQRASNLHGQLKKTADNDAVQMGVGLVLLWPTLFFLEGGDGPQAHEYARLKGERDAIERVAIQKKCGIEFKDMPPKLAPQDSKPEPGAS